MTPEKIERYVENRLKYVGKFALQTDAPATPAALRKPHSKKRWTALPEPERVAHLRAVLTEEATNPAAPSAPTPAPALAPALSAGPRGRARSRRPVAVVQCAGGCGRLLPAPSTVRPVLRYCGAGADAGHAHAADVPPAREESISSAIRRYLRVRPGAGNAAETRASKAKRRKAERPKCLTD